MIEFVEKTVHGLVGRGKSSGIHQHDCRLLNISAAVDFATAVKNEPFKTLRGGFEVKLQTDDTLVENKTLMVTSIAFCQVHRTARQIGCVAVPVKYRQSVWQGSGQSSLFRRRGFVVNRKPSDLVVPVGFNGRP
jgi:hypothetical protein